MKLSNTIASAWLGLGVTTYCCADQVYVTNEMSGDLTVIDDVHDGVIATIPLGKRPRGIRASADGKFLYVALSGSPVAGPASDERTLPPPDKAADGIGVIDVAARKMVRILKGVSDPEQLDVSRDGKRLYVASEDTGSAVVLDARSGAVLASIPVGGEPEGVTLRPDGGVVYVTSERDDLVTAIDTRSNRIVRQFKVGQRPRAIAFSPDSSRAYVTGENDASVSVIDARQHRVIRKINLTGAGMRPMGVVVSPNGHWVYVATGRGGKILALETATLTVKWSAPAGERPWGIAVNPNGTRIYTANGPSNDVSIIDTRTHSNIATVRAGNRPWGILSRR